MTDKAKLDKAKVAALHMLQDAQPGFDMMQTYIMSSGKVLYGWQIVDDCAECLLGIVDELNDGGEMPNDKADAIVKALCEIQAQPPLCRFGQGRYVHVWPEAN